MSGDARLATGLLALHNLASAGAAVVHRYTAAYWLLLKADVR